MQTKVPYFDLKLQHDLLRNELNAAIQEVIDEGAFAGGPFVTRFEADFAAYCDCPYAIGVGSGTEALWLCLLALGVGPGDDVITVPNTFMATAEAISYGYQNPRDVVRQLIVDDGVQGRGHRKVLFDSLLRFAGVGCGPHRVYGAMCVIDFSGTMIAR